MNELEIKGKLKEFIVSELRVEEDALEFDTLLFDEGVGLDSIDSVEIISFVDEEFGVSMTGVDKEHFQSIDTITSYIVAHAE